MTRMEATRSRRRTSRSSRRPFSDCTNTIGSINPSQSSSTSTRNSPPFIKPSLLNTNTDKTGTSPIVGGKGDSNPSNPTAVLVPSVSTPSWIPKHSCPEVGKASPMVSEPSSVYGRRQSADKRKRKGKEIALSMSCFPAIKTRFNRDEMSEDGVTSLSKSCTEPKKKKRHQKTAKENVAQHALPQDFVEQQRAYFAEVDAFELSEEEVASIDELD